METNIFERDKEAWTRFKVPSKQIRMYTPLLNKYVDVSKPVKRNSRYTYYEVKGDLLNRREGETCRKQQTQNT